jgi:hypothetical protein
VCRRRPLPSLPRCFSRLRPNRTAPIERSTSRQTELSTSQNRTLATAGGQIGRRRRHIPAQAAARPHPGEGTAPSSHTSASGLKARRARGRSGGVGSPWGTTGGPAVVAHALLLPATKGHAAHLYSAHQVVVPTWLGL